MSNRFKFPKPLEMYKPLEPYGPHIVASDYDEWKRYRKVCAPAFAEVRVVAVLTSLSPCLLADL